MQFNYENRSVNFEFRREDNLVFAQHLHKQIELVRVDSGELTVIVDDGEHVLTAGSVFLALPNTIHGYRTDKPNTYTIVIFDTALVSDFAAEIGGSVTKYFIIPPEQIHRDVLYCLDAMNDLKLQQLAIDARLLCGYLLVIMSRGFINSNLDSKTQGGYTEGNDAWQGVMHHALLYMNDKFCSNLTLSSVSREIGVSKFVLSHGFSATFGCNFSTYLKTLRIDHAKMLLHTTRKTITDVAYSCGFESECTFYRAFKEQTGVTPKQYRMNAATMKLNS